MEINMNCKVRVKLTHAGRKHLLDRHIALCSQAGVEIDYEPREEVDGWSCWQLWELMGSFSELMRYPTLTPPFEPNIQLLGEGSVWIMTNGTFSGDTDIVGVYGSEAVALASRDRELSECEGYGLYVAQREVVCQL